MSTKKLLVVGAHSADFVWRSAGAIAVTTSQGGSATVVALSYGERGESGELWKEPDQTVENVKCIRHEQAEDRDEHHDVAECRETHSLTSRLSCDAGRIALALSRC